MLILTRSVGHIIRIGDDIKVTILETQGMQVRLGIQAPREIAVHREEIYQRIAMEKARQGAQEVEDAIGNC